MNDIEKKLRASVRFDAVNGTAMDRAICNRQMAEAAGYIQHLEVQLREIRAARDAAPDPATVVAEAGALAELLEQAAEDIQEWGAYASAYFQEKHNLAANVAKYREAARRLLARGE